MLILDLFSGLGGASAGFRDAGWEVVTVDVEPRFSPTVVADLTHWSHSGPRPDFVWASPPCTEFSRESMPWSRTGRTPDLSLVRAAKRVIDECNPQWWVIENVRGAVKYLRPLLGEFRASYGPFFLWGRFPRFRCRIRKRKKESFSSTQRAERAMVPRELSEAMARACGRSLFAN